MNERYLDILKNIELFSHLPTYDREGLFSAFHTIKMMEDETLFSRGDPPDALYVVLSGSLVAILDKEDGTHESIGKIEHAGTLVGEVGLLMDNPRLFTVKALTNATLLKLTKADFSNFINAHPQAICQILVKNMVGKVELFRHINQEVLDKLASKFSLIDLEQDSMLFSQGELSDIIYIVLSGYLIAFLEKSSGHIKIVGKIGSGELIGEMGTLTGKTRSLSIKALTPVKLLKLTKEDFLEFVDAHPSILYPMLLSTIKRAQSTVGILSEKSSNAFIALVPANYRVHADEFIKQLRNFDQPDNKNKIFYLTSEELNKLYLKENLAGLLSYFEQLETTYSSIVYVLNANCPNNLVKILSQKANKIIVLGQGGTKHYLSDFSAELLEKPELTNLPKILVLLWSKAAEIQRTSIWLNKADFKIHFHIFEQDAESHQRFLRFLRGKLVGLVLGGGGLRAWFHLGVIKAMEEKNIPIDVIGGTSSGAGVAACYLKFGGGARLVDMVENFSHSLLRSVSWTSFTFPVISFYSATPATKEVQTIFGQERIENFKIPYFAISCNISNNAEVIHRTGPVWQALRSTATVPFLFPPFVKNGQLLYDGGLVNNLPVDQMLDLIHEGIIIASDLGVVMEDDTIYDFPPMLPAGRILLSKLHLTKRYHFPDFFETTMKAVLMGSVPRYRHNIQLADYYISPNFKGSSLMVKKKLWARLLQLGYENALTALENWKY